MIINVLIKSNGDKKFSKLKDEKFFSETKEIIKKFKELVNKIDNKSPHEYGILAIDIYSEAIKGRFEKWEELAYAGFFRKNKIKKSIVDEYLQTRKEFEKIYLTMLKRIAKNKTITKGFNNFDEAIEGLFGLTEEDIIESLICEMNLSENDEKSKFYKYANNEIQLIIQHMSSSQKEKLSKVISKLNLGKK
jgi:hypothetical protein